MRDGDAQSSWVIRRATPPLQMTNEIFSDTKVIFTSRRPPRCLARRLRGWHREPNLDLETGRVREHFDLCAVKTGNGSYQAQSETVSRSVATVLESIKTLEDLFAFVGGNSRPVLGDRYDRCTVNDFASNH